MFGGCFRRQRREVANAGSYPRKAGVAWCNLAAISAPFDHFLCLGAILMCSKSDPQGFSRNMAELSDHKESPCKHCP